MIEVPSRIAGLIQRLEAGDHPTADELRTIATLQALDCAKAGEDFAKEMAQREDKLTQEYISQ